VDSDWFGSVKSTKALVTRIVLVSDCWHKGSNEPISQNSGGGRRKNEVRSLVRVSASCFLQCFDSGGWMAGRTWGS